MRPRFFCRSDTMTHVCAAFLSREDFALLSRGMVRLLDPHLPPSMIGRASQGEASPQRILWEWTPIPRKPPKVILT
jgi:hypothetical protein